MPDGNEAEVRLYRHSGEFSMAGMAAATLGGAAVGILLAWLYELSLRLISDRARKTSVACAGFGAAVGLCTAWILRSFKCRNTFLTLALGLLMTAIAFVASWDFWVYQLLDNMSPGEVSLYSVVTKPAVVWRVIVRVNRFGTWSFGTSMPPVTGLELWVMWAGEAAIIFACSFLCSKLVGDAPFCEKCRSWCKKTPVGTRVRLPDPALAKSDAMRIASGDFSVITQRGLRADGDPDWIDFEVYRCGNCTETVTLTVKHWRLVERNGAVGAKSVTLVRKAMLSPEQYEQFRSAFTQLLKAEEASGQEEGPTAG